MAPGGRSTTGRICRNRAPAAAAMLRADGVDLRYNREHQLWRLWWWPRTPCRGTLLCGSLRCTAERLHGGVKLVKVDTDKACAAAVAGFLPSAIICLMVRSVTCR